MYSTKHTCVSRKKCKKLIASGTLRVLRQKLAIIRRALPQHVVAEFLGLGAHSRKHLELGSEDLVGVRFLVLLERAPVGDDGVMFVRGSGFSERALVGHETRELEDLASEETALVTAVSFLDDVTHLAHGQFNLLEGDPGFQLHSVEQHLGAVRQGNRVKHCSSCLPNRSWGP